MRFSRQPGDHGLLRAINGREGPGWSTWLGTVDRAAYPVMIGTIPAWWAVRLAEGDRQYADAWQASVAWVSSYAVMASVKRLVRRERPFVSVPGIVRRTGYPGGRHIDRWAFPSGHALITASIATSLALSSRSWAVAVPAAAWAVSVGVSRVWLGVHYPGDVVAGWVMGSAVAWGVHALGDAITPRGLRGRSPAPVLHLSLAIR